MKPCSHCQEELSTPLVCMGCGALPEVEDISDLSPFAVLGLLEDWNVDPKRLKQQLLRLSRAVHPDFFATADEPTRQRAESASAALNAAHQTLHDDIRRADWLVQSRGGPSETDERQMPKAFLMQVIEWNEALEQARESEEGSAEWVAMEQLGAQLEAERQEHLEEIAGLLMPLPEHGVASLGEARRELNAVRYIDRTHAEIRNLQLKASLGNRP